MGQLPVSRSVAEGIFRRLSGFRGYPHNPTGEGYFIDAFQCACVSVAHAEAVIASFDELMPTVKEIRDTAANLKPRFLPPSPSQREEWEKQYGPPDPGFYDQVMKQAATPQKSRDAELWSKLREKFPTAGRKKNDWPSWRVLAAAARELGYDDYARAWEKSAGA